MRKKTLQILGVAVLVAVAAWLGFQVGGEKPKAKRAAAARPGGMTDGASTGAGSAPPQPPPPPAMGAASTNPPPTSPAVPTGGELLHEWLTSSQDVHEIAEVILRGWPQLKPEDHAMVVKELIPLVTDDRYHGLRTLLLDPRTSVEAKDMLFRDLIRRPKDLHLPLFLALLRQSPRHPSADEAKNMLYVRLGEDYGTDWAKWQARINEELSP